MPPAVPAPEPWVVLVTHPTDGAEAFAQRLVEARLAACVNVLPATSVYRWEGAVQRDAESLLVVKTLAARKDELAAFLARHHPYEVPELVALPMAFVGRAYGEWLLREASA